MKENVTKFDLNAAFKSLDEIDIPAVDGLKANRLDLKENVRNRKLKTDLLLEDYYDINDSEDLAAAADDRAEEVAQAKLARIEKIVDLDAQTADELLPSYVGKVIMQCPQCMTLFYKDLNDIVHSEDDDNTVNVGEKCQHCGNESGYTLVGKVDAVEPEAPAPVEEPAEEPQAEAAPAEEAPAQEEAPAADEAALDEVSAEDSNNAEAGEEDELDELDLDFPEAEDEEEKNESLNLNKEFHGIDKKRASENDSENLSLNEEASVDESVNLNKEFHDIDKKRASDNDSENLSLNEGAEDKELLAKLDKHNQYIAYLQKLIEQDEEALENAKKVKDNDAVIKAIEKRIAATKEDLNAALPEAVKEETAASEELPTAEEAGVEAVENKENADDEIKLEAIKESLTEARDPSDNADEDPTVNRIRDLKKMGREPLKYVFYTRFKDGTIDKIEKDDIKPSQIHGICAEAAEADDVEGVYVAAIYKNENNEEEEFPLDKYTIDKAVVIMDDPVDEALDNKKEEQSYPQNEGEFGLSPTAAEESLMNKDAEEYVDHLTTENRTLHEEELVYSEEAADAMMNSKEFTTPVSDAEVENLLATEAFDMSEADDIDECKLQDCFSEALTKVYENVSDFTATSCELTEEGKFVVEGTINFISGTQKPTKYVFESITKNDHSITMRGVNESLAKDSKFLLNCSLENKVLVPTCLEYSYSINESLVQGTVVKR